MIVFVLSLFTTSLSSTTTIGRSLELAPPLVVKVKELIVDEVEDKDDDVEPIIEVSVVGLMGLVVVVGVDVLKLVPDVVVEPVLGGVVVASVLVVDDDVVGDDVVVVEVVVEVVVVLVVVGGRVVCVTTLRSLTFEMVHFVMQKSLCHRPSKEKVGIVYMVGKFCGMKR